MSSSDVRRKIVVGAADMIRRRGLAATTIRDLAEHAQAPLGSTYHYFPGGKQQVAAEAVRYAGDVVLRTLGRELEAGPVAGLRAFLGLWRETVLRTGFRAGCPVLAVAIEEPPGAEPTEAVVAAAEVFAAWETMIAGSLRRHGAGDAQAVQVATLIVAAVEGTIAMCRAKRDIQPLDDVSAQLEALVSAMIHH
jgi:AcrR family transcriptional regulator